MPYEPIIDPPRPQKRDAMDKFWLVYSQKTILKCSSKQSAIDEAKRRVNSGELAVYVLKAVGVAKKPLPDIEFYEFK